MTLCPLSLTSPKSPDRDLDKLSIQIPMIDYELFLVVWSPFHTPTNL